MNKIQKELNKKKTLELVKRESLYRTSVGNVKCWGLTSYSHFITMAKIVWKLSKQGYSCYTEIEFINGGRADILAIADDGTGYVIEVLHSESDEKYESKLSSYPEELIMSSVKTKDFDINRWDL